MFCILFFTGQTKLAIEFRCTKGGKTRDFVSFGGIVPWNRVDVFPMGSLNTHRETYCFYSCAFCELWTPVRRRASIMLHLLKICSKYIWHLGLYKGKVLKKSQRPLKCFASTHLAKNLTHLKSFAWIHAIVWSMSPPMVGYYLCFVWIEDQTLLAFCAKLYI